MVCILKKKQHTIPAVVIPIASEGLIINGLTTPKQIIFFTFFRDKSQPYFPNPLQLLKITLILQSGKKIIIFS